MSSILRFSPASFLGLPSFGSLRKPAREPSLQPARIAGTYPKSPTESQPDANGVDMARLLAAVRVAPDLPLIEWDGDRSRLAQPQAAANDEGEDPRRLEPRRRKIRDRYISARFPGVARNGADLESAARVVKAARLYFEEDDIDTALELLQLAIEEAPHESPLRLAQLELLFLARDRDAFVHAANAFADAHPGHEAWAEVARLGRAIAPDEALFGNSAGPREHDHYGPWPHLPNWIQAPWDLTGEVVAVDFHRAMARALPRAAFQQNA